MGLVRRDRSRHAAAEALLLAAQLEGDRGARDLTRLEGEVHAWAHTATSAVLDNPGTAL